MKENDYLTPFVIVRIGDKHNVSIKFSDTGRGIPAEELDTIFDFKFTSTTSRVGFGLDLVSAYDIIHKHNGDILVESEVDKGSIFTIQLPITHDLAKKGTR